MASRQVVAQRAALREHVREGIRKGTYRPGRSLPSSRELGNQFDLSRDSVQAELRQLIAEGLLEAIPRKGVFVSGHAIGITDTCYVMLIGRTGKQASRHAEAVREGFELQISQYGGISLVLPDNETRLPDAPLGGIFSFCCAESAELRSLSGPVPRVWYGQRAGRPGDGVIDRVALDNLGGGASATQHLLERGHRRVGFLARHLPTGPDDWQWAREREIGWRSAMAQNAPEEPLVSFRPVVEDRTGIRSVNEFTRLAAQRAVEGRHSVDALVAVDDWAIAAFLEIWRAEGLPESEIPAMVGFEDLPEARNATVTSVRPPWEELGRTAAELLWQRHVGQIRGGSVTRTLDMAVTARLSSRRRARTSAAVS